MPSEKIIVVPNWADENGVHPIDRKDNYLVKKYNLDLDKFYIVYCGNIGYTQNMDLLLDVAKKLYGESTDVVFIIIGDGVDRDRIEQRIINEKINNVIMLPFQPYEYIAHVFSLGDVGLIISKQGVGNNSVPSKTWSIMAAGKPILASFDKESELCELIKNANCGKSVEANSIDQLLNAIHELRDCDIKKLGENGFHYVKTFQNKNSCVQMYVKTLSDLLD